MAYRPMRAALRDGAMGEQAAQYDLLKNIVDFLTIFSGGTWSLERGATAVAPTLASTAVEIDQVCDVSTRQVAAGGTLTVTAALHAGRIIKLDTAAGSVCTLPAATGTGNVYRFMTTVIATSNSHVIKVANGTDVMSGGVLVVDNADGTCTPFGTVAASDTMTFNRTTTGSVKVGGELIEITDVAAGYFNVRGTVVATGTEATPFSATV